MTACLIVTRVIWTYLKIWVAAHCIGSTVLCIVKTPISSTYYTAQRKLTVCLESPSAILNYVKDGPANLKSLC